MSRGEIELSAEMIYGFVATVLMANFDKPQPIPSCHMEWWELACSPQNKIAIAAPRGHAKSTAITHSFVLAAMMFRFRDHCMIVSDSEDQACAFLNDIKMELTENDSLRILFGVDRLLKDKESECIVRFTDGHTSRIIARGSGQKLRGLKWRHKRPNLIVGDDLENDEMVMNSERRTKFREWFYSALLPAGSDDCIFRIVGTILHLDSMLERLMPSLGEASTEWTALKSYSTRKKSWTSFRYKAHDEDFSNILWPEKFSKERLLAIRQDYMDQGYPEGYAQEYLNYPIDDTTAFFKKSDFSNTYNYEDLTDLPLTYYSAMDFAISNKQRADYTAIVTVALDSNGFMYVVDVRRGRWDAKEIIDEMFDVQYIYKPELFTVETGVIEKAIGPFLKDEMLRSGIFINLNKLVPGQDKQTRARSIQARLRQGGIAFDTGFEWWEMFADEMRTFPRGAHDDMVDAFSYIGLALDKMTDAPTRKEYEDEQWEEFVRENEEPMGKCLQTGY